MDNIRIAANIINDDFKLLEDEISYMIMGCEQDKIVSQNMYDDGCRAITRERVSDLFCAIDKVIAPLERLVDRGELWLTEVMIRLEQFKLAVEQEYDAQSERCDNLRDSVYYTLHTLDTEQVRKDIIAIYEGDNSYEAVSFVSLIS